MRNLRILQAALISAVMMTSLSAQTPKEDSPEPWSLDIGRPPKQAVQKKKNPGSKPPEIKLDASSWYKYQEEKKKMEAESKRAAQEWNRLYRKQLSERRAEQARILEENRRSLAEYNRKWPGPLKEK